MSMIHPSKPVDISFWQWPGTAWVFLAGVAALYAPTLADAVNAWMRNDNYAHGFFVFPIAIAILWLQKDHIRKAPQRPEIWGFAPLAFGTILQAGSYLLQIKYIGMLSLVPTLIGGILLLHGRSLWNVVHFPIWFLFFAAPLPNVLLGHITGWIQSVSTVGAASLMSLLGCPLLRQGNLISVPGATLEVATACSGFHKLISLLAFAALYGFFSGATQIKRLLLMAAAIPIALLANVLRISSLVAAAENGGKSTLHFFHDPAEIVAILLAFAFFVLFGRIIGCRTIELSQLSAAL